MWLETFSSPVMSHSRTLGTDLEVLSLYRLLHMYKQRDFIAHREGCLGLKMSSALVGGVAANIDS